MNPLSRLIDLLLDRVVYKGKTGEVIWFPEDLNHPHEVHGHLIVRTPEGPMEVPYSIANRNLARHPSGTMIMRIVSQAIEEGMKPVAIRIGNRIVSPYSPVPLKEEDIWPQGFAHAA